MHNTLLPFGGNEGTKKVFEMYFSLEISVQFLDCLDIQLTKLFQEKTGISIKPPIRMVWGQEKGFIYKKETVSKINSQIYLRNGIVEPWILWKSKSGRIYEIADTDINCDDIEFWFDGLDAEVCRNYLKPNWTLFTLEINKGYVIKELNKHSIDVSGEFLKCADDQLTALFTKLTGIKTDKNVGIVIPSYSEDPLFPGRQPILEPGKITRLKITLFVNHGWNFIEVLWKSKSGRIYKMSDTDIDCTDIEFWFEPFDATLYIEQYYPKGKKLPFVLKDLPYELVVTRLNLNCELLIKVTNEVASRRESIATNINKFMGGFNDISEKQDRDEGVIHNSISKVEGDNDIVFEIDLGSVGFSFFKKLLRYLAKIEGIERVEIA